MHGEKEEAHKQAGRGTGQTEGQRENNEEPSGGEPQQLQSPEPQHTQILYTSVTHTHMHTLAGTSEKGPAKQMLSQ